MLIYHGCGAILHRVVCLFTPLLLIAPTLGRVARLIWSGWLFTYWNETITHPSINRVRLAYGRANTLIKASALPVSQITTGILVAMDCRYVNGSISKEKQIIKWTEDMVSWIYLLRNNYTADTVTSRWLNVDRLTCRVRLIGPKANKTF